jgi:hypothetical protein
VVTGLWLRARGYLYDVIPLWLDEADWATRLFEQPLLDHLIRPPGFMALSKAITSTFTRSEAGLRFLPWAAGIGAVLVTPTLAKQLFRSGGARLLCVAAIALHPAAIDLSKEFKPYSVALLLHLALLSLTLRYSSSGKTSHLAWLCVVALPSVLFAQDVIFAYPAVFSLTAFEAFKAKRTSHLICTVLVTLATLALVLTMYFLVWSRIDMQVEAPYWGEKYNVFHVPSSTGPSYARWFYDRYFEIANLPGLRGITFNDKKTWAWLGSKPHPFIVAYEYLWFGLHLAGVITLFARRRFHAAFLLCSPLLALAVTNFLGMFPMASFRADFFLVAYVVPIAAFAFERSKLGASWLDPLPAALLLVLPLLVFERDWHASKRFFAGMSWYPTVFSDLLSLQPAGKSTKPEKLVLDERSCVGWRYYVQYHPEFSPQVGSQLLKRFSAVCIIKPNERKGLRLMLRRVDPGGNPEASGWALIQSNKRYIRWARRTMPRRLEVVRTRWIGGRHTIMEIKRRQAEPVEDDSADDAPLPAEPPALAAPVRDLPATDAPADEGQN